MKFSPSFLDEIRAPVSEVVGKTVKLRRKGREWAGLSPFNKEKTPSFFVNDQKGFYKDFSSGKHGDAFTFLMETEGLSFPEAVERLAGIAGLAMPVQSEASIEDERKRATLHETLALAAAFFRRMLNDRAGARARGYLADRGLAADIQTEFGLGYAPPDRYALRDALAAAGVGADQMVAAGLLIHGEDIAVPYDRFRDRVMFPIEDRAGRPIAFGGRALDPTATAKYLNSPETELFHKGSILFNHHRARKAAHDKGQVIAVEGYVDVIAMSRAGFPQTVAPLGTALTADQCQMLWQMADEPLLCFDGDSAGRKAAFRAIDTALPLLAPGKSLRFALLPDGQDPDDLARSGGGAAIQEVLDAANSLADMLFQRETEAQAFDTPERRAGLEKRLRDLTAAIADENVRRYYWQEMQARLSTLLGGRREPKRFTPDARGRFRKGEPPTARLGFASSPLTAPSTLMARDREPPRELIIVAIALHHPDLLARHAEELATLDFAGRRLAAFRDRLLCLDIDERATPDIVATLIDAAGLADERRRIVARAGRMADWWSIRPEAAPSDAEEVLRQTLVLHRKARALNRELKSAEAALAKEFNELNVARLRDIQSHLADLAGAEAIIEGFGALSGRSASPV
jgi:DNA primase